MGRDEKWVWGAGCGVGERGGRAHPTNRVQTQAALSVCLLPGTVTNRPTIVP